MYAVSDESRTFLKRLAAMSICGGIAILPFTVPPTSTTARAQTTNQASLISVPDLPGKLSFPAISVKRDPFVADASADAPVATDSSNSAQNIDIALPPNAGAGLVPEAASATSVPVVRGVVLGDTPEALVEFGSGVKVVSVGDSIGGETIRAIDAAGVTLSSGLRIRITGKPR